MECSNQRGVADFTHKHSLFVLHDTKIDHRHEVKSPFCFISLLNKIPLLILWRHVHGLPI